MHIPILIEPVGGSWYRSRGGEPFGLSAEGVTREEVVRVLQTQLRDRIRSGAQIFKLDAMEAAASNPWVEFAGMFKDDPYFAEWQEAIAENRRKAEDNPAQ